MGTVLIAAVQGVICGVVTNGDPDEISWRQNLDALNFMMADTAIPHETRVTVRRYFRNSKRLFKRKSFQPLVDDCLSHELQRDVRYQIASGVFQGVWWLSACERDFLEDLSVRVSRVAFGPQEPILAHDTLIVITHGMASRGGIFLAVGDHFGDIIVSSPVLRDTTQAKALSYCEVARISRKDLYSVLEAYPTSQKVIRQASLKIAMERAMTIIAIYVNLSRSEGRRVDGGRDTPKESEGSDALAQRRAHQVVVSITGDPSIPPDPTKMLQATFGGLFGGWRNIAKDHKGREILLEPGESINDRRFRSTCSPQSFKSTPTTSPSNIRGPGETDNQQVRELRHEITQHLQALEQKMDARMGEMSELFNAFLRSAASPSSKSSGGTSKAVKAIKAARKAARPPPLPGAGPADAQGIRQDEFFAIDREDKRPLKDAPPERTRSRGECAAPVLASATTSPMPSHMALAPAQAPVAPSESMIPVTRPATPPITVPSEAPNPVENTATTRSRGTSNSPGESAGTGSCDNALNA